MEEQCAFVVKLARIETAKVFVTLPGQWLQLHLLATTLVLKYEAVVI
jgi:hypothetical protein